MSREESLIEIIKAALPLPPRVVVGYKNLDNVFTSGDLARICDISRSSAKFYVGKMVELRLVAKVLIKECIKNILTHNILAVGFEI